jgi:methyl-accepting chemotaxis protein
MPILSDVYISSDGSRSIASLISIRDNSNNVKGVLNIEINLDQLTE